MVHGPITVENHCRMSMFTSTRTRSSLNGLVKGLPEKLVTRGAIEASAPPNSQTLHQNF